MNWDDYFKSLGQSEIIVVGPKGAHGIAYVTRYLENLAGKFRSLNSRSTLGSPKHLILTHIKARYVFPDKRIDTYIFHDATSYKYSSKFKSFLLKQIQGALLKKSKNIVCISRFALDELRNYHTVDERKVRVIYNELVAVEKRPLFLWVGSEKAHKRIDIILECSKNVDADFLLVGAVKRKGYPNVTFVDNLSNTVYEMCLAMSDCIVVTSDEEGFHLPTAQAMALHKPVIALNIPVLRELYSDRVILCDDRGVLTERLRDYAASCK